MVVLGVGIVRGGCVVGVVVVGGHLERGWRLGEGVARSVGTGAAAAAAAAAAAGAG